MKTLLLLMLCLLVIAHVTMSLPSTPEEDARFKGYAKEDFDSDYDTDKNGYIELSELLEKYGKNHEFYSDATAEWMKNYCRKFITDRDTDGDGKVNFEEYYHYQQTQFGVYG